VLRPGLVGGLAIADARATRVWVDAGGAVRMSRRGGREGEVCAPGTITRLSVVPADAIRARRFVPAARRGLAVLWSGERPLVAINLVELGVDRRYPDDATYRATSGLDAFAEALGLVVEAATPEEVRRARSLGQADLLPLHDPADHPRWQPAAGALALLLSFLTWPAATVDLEWLAVPLALVCVTPLVLRWRRRRLAAFSLMTAAPDPDGRVVVRPAPPADLRLNTLTETEVQVGDHDVVVRAGGREWWLPGPAAGGVARVLASPDGIVLGDRRDRPYLGLDRRVWGAPAEALLAALREVGAQVEETPVDDQRLVEYVGTRHEVGDWPTLRDHQDGGGDQFTSTLLSLSVLVLGVGCAAAAVTLFPFGLLALAAWVWIAVLAAQTVLVRWRWQRHQRARAVTADGPTHPAEGVAT
jgi:hypothetical protein